MRTLKTAVLAVVMGLLYSASSAQEAAKTPPKDYTDHEFGFSLHTEGFTEMELLTEAELMSVYINGEDGQDHIDLEIEKNQTASEYAQVFGAGSLMLGVKEKARKDAKLGSLKATQIDYEGGVAGTEIAMRLLLADDNGRLWRMTMAGLKANKDANGKIFDDMAKTFKNTYKPDPKKPPAETVVCSERIGYWIDTKGCKGPRTGMEGVTPAAFVLVSSDERRGILITSYIPGAQPPGKLKEMHDEAETLWSDRGFEVKKKEMAKLAGKEALKMTLQGELADAERHIVVYSIIQPDGVFMIWGAWVVTAGEDTIEVVTKCVESFKFVPIKQGGVAKPAEKPVEKPAPKAKGK
ncbi:MAG: hypothetical protein IT463_06715 [Planctomycetes bacterium]|nr:hypothetical protein [Planctomycetota bacterium]